MTQPDGLFIMRRNNVFKLAILQKGISGIRNSEPFAMCSDMNPPQSAIQKKQQSIHLHENHLSSSRCACLKAYLSMYESHRCFTQIHNHRGTMSTIMCNRRIENRPNFPSRTIIKAAESLKHPHLAVEDVEHVVLREAIQPRAHPRNRGAYKVAPALFTGRHGLDHLSLQCADIRSGAAVAHDDVVRLWHGHAAVDADFLPGRIRPPCKKAFRRLWIPHLVRCLRLLGELQLPSLWLQDPSLRMQASREMRRGLMAGGPRFGNQVWDRSKIQSLEFRVLRSGFCV